MPPSRELTAGEVQDRATLDAALDCVICMDDHGGVTYFNESARRTFGYGVSGAVGQELAEVIVPPSLRDAHRQGLARFIGTGESRILGRRLELTAMRADGTEFPAELTVTRLKPPNGPGFIGFVRDITERLRAEVELRAARARFEVIANEQAALRRVATLVARQATSDELFAAVSKEVVVLLGVRYGNVLRFDSVGNVTLVGAWGEGPPLAPGDGWPLEEALVAGVIWRTGRPASVDLADFDSPLAADMLRNDLRFATGVPIVVESQLWGVIRVLERTREALPPDVVGRLESFTELVATAVANATARAELVAARRRVIEAADAARARVTRDMHDGAQQKFVNSLIHQQLAQDKWSSDPARARELLDIGAEEADLGIEMLREVAAGIHPTILSDMGLEAALEGLAARVPIPVTLDVGEVALPRSLETSVYFVCSEALTNVIKHSSATSAAVQIAAADGWLSIEIRDDGVGGAEIGAGGSGLLGLSDRIGALEGSFALSSPRGGAGTTLIARIPLPT
ncbi:MAG: PAS domain S-box protein [Solirubrobacteraceae bacterium]